MAEDLVRQKVAVYRPEHGPRYRPPAGLQRNDQAVYDLEQIANVLTPTFTRAAGRMTANVATLTGRSEPLDFASRPRSRRPVQLPATTRTAPAGRHACETGRRWAGIATATPARLQSADTLGHPTRKRSDTPRTCASARLHRIPLTLGTSAIRSCARTPRIHGWARSHLVSPLPKGTIDV